MKLANAPGRRQQRRLDALKRYPNKPNFRGVTTEDKPKISARWKTDLDRLTLIAHSIPVEEARRVRTKRDHSSRAKIGRNG